MYVLITQKSILLKTTVHGKYWWGKILANHAGKSYWYGKIWQKATVSVYAIYIFHVPVNIDEKKFGKWLMICQIHQFFTLPKFSHVQHNDNYFCLVFSYIL